MVFGFAGITDVTFVNAQPLDYTPDLTTMMMAQATNSAVELASSLDLG